MFHYLLLIFFFLTCFCFAEPPIYPGFSLPFGDSPSELSERLYPGFNSSVSLWNKMYFQCLGCIYIFFFSQCTQQECGRGATLLHCQWECKMIQLLQQNADFCVPSLQFPIEMIPLNTTNVPFWATEPVEAHSYSWCPVSTPTTHTHTHTHTRKNVFVTLYLPEKCEISIKT